MDTLLSVADVAARLGMSGWKVRRLIASGELPASNFGSAARPEYRVDPAAVERLIVARRVAVARPRARGRAERVPDYV